MKKTVMEYAELMDSDYTQSVDCIMCMFDWNIVYISFHGAN